MADSQFADDTRSRAGDGLRAPASLSSAGDSARPAPRVGREDLADGDGGEARAEPARACVRCKHKLPATAFRLKNGRRLLTCKLCCNEVRVAQERAARELRMAGGNLKKCIMCLKMKPLLDFPALATSEDRLGTKCTECVSRYHREKCLPGSLTVERYATENMGRPFRVKRICTTCCDLPHRIEGLRCRECGCARSSAKPLRAEDFTGLHSSAAIAVDEG